MPDIRIEKGALLVDGETVQFAIPTEPSGKEAFLLRHRGEFFAFLNECPHWSVDLDMGDGHFFDKELELLYCKNHGALFCPSSGLCETGPCLGRSLTSYATRVEGEDVVVSL